MHCCQVWLSQIHTWAFFFPCIQTFFSTRGFDFHRRKGSRISPPLRLFYPSFFSMYSTVPSLPFKLPCVFLSSSFNLFMLSPPLFPLSYLSISPGFTPPHPFFFSPASNLLPSLLTRARFPSLIFFLLGRWGRGSMHASFSPASLVVYSPPTRSKTLMDTISRIPE